MNSILKTAIFTTGIAVAASVFAGERTVTLEVEGMSCAACPYIVKRSLADVDGVTAVKVSLADQSAVVTFDDSKTEVADLTLATSNMGFPSTLGD